MTSMIFSGHSYALSVFQRLFLWMLSNAFSKSMKFMCTLLFHSMDCYIIFLNVNIWSIQPTPSRNPAGSFQKYHLWHHSVSYRWFCRIFYLVQTTVLFHASSLSMAEKNCVHQQDLSFIKKIWRKEKNMEILQVILS